MESATPHLTLTAGELAGSPFASVRSQPWLMVLLGPLMVGLHRDQCRCGQDCLTRDFHAGTVALVSEDCNDEAGQTARRALGGANSLELMQRVIAAPCWVTGGPLRIRSLRAAMPAHVRDSMTLAADSMSLPLAPHRRITLPAGDCVANACPACGEPLGDAQRGQSLVLAMETDENGADMRPVPMVECL